MEKCVFLGYPEGYKGWKFYNPTTKQTLISERADFDERYFPMLKRLPLPSQPLPAVPNTAPTSPPVEYYTPLCLDQPVIALSGWLPVYD